MGDTIISTGTYSAKLMDLFRISVMAHGLSKAELQQTARHAWQNQQSIARRGPERSRSRSMPAMKPTSLKK